MTATVAPPVPAVAVRPAAPTAWQGTGVLTQIRVLAGRSLRGLREPRLLLPSLIEPLILLVLFGQVFSSIAKTPGFPPGVSYIDYLLPAILITTGVGAGLQSGATLTAEMRNGVIGRFRSMPIRTVSILAARGVADAVRLAFELVILVVLGALMFGFSPAGGIAGTMGGLLMGVLVGITLGWVFMAVAAGLRRPEVVQMVGSLATFPLMFASNAFVTIENLPGWLQVFASVNPLSYAITASRGLALGEPNALAVLSAVAICLAITAVAMPLAIRSFRRAT